MGTVKMKDSAMATSNQKACVDLGAPAGTELTSAGPAMSAAALERLDPRETFAIEFHFRDGSVATAKFEAGDFAAGRAFLAMGIL